MSEENAQEQPQGKTYTEEEVKALLEQETSGMRSKLDELLGESKTAKQRARELEQAQEQAEAQRLAEKQEFKTLYEREQESKRTLQEQFEDFQKRVQRAEIEKTASRIAGELTRDSGRGELLAEKAASYARYSEDGVTYELGGVQVDREKVIDHLRERFPFLVDGNGSSGGGATGSKGGGAAGKKLSEMTGMERVELRRNNPEEYQRLKSQS